MSKKKKPPSKKKPAKKKKVVKKKPLPKKKKPLPKKKKKVVKKRKKRLSKTKAPLEAPPSFEVAERDLPDNFESAYERIISEFKRAQIVMEEDYGYQSPEPLVHTYFPIPEKGYPGEIDAEWRIDGVRGADTSTLLHRMQESLDWPVLGEGYWITVGIRFHGKGEMDERTGQWSMIAEDHYRKHEGMLEVTSNYRRMQNKARTISAFNAILEGSSKNPTPMFKAVEKKYGRKVAQVFVRINWNPEDKQPKR